jgi:hypothetical protein
MSYELCKWRVLYFPFICLQTELGHLYNGIIVFIFTREPQIGSLDRSSLYSDVGIMYATSAAFCESSPPQMASLSPS